MATKSILKTINIKDANAAKRMVYALENAKVKRVNESSQMREAREASRDEISSLFRDKE